MTTGTARAIALVRQTLREVGYDEPGLQALLGAADPLLTPAEQEALWAFRARGADRLSVLARLFLLGRPVPTAGVRRALGDPAPWRAVGLLRLGPREARPRVHLGVHGGLLVASDPPPAGEAPPAHVFGATTATLLLERMLLPLAGGTALDVGTGSGYLGLRLASRFHAVTGTDVAPRALRYARFNAALNGVANAAFVRSDRFAALRGRRFDVIVGNLPFVLGPRRRHVFRDAGAPDDRFFSSVIRHTGRHLVEGGFAQLLGQWIGREGEDEEARLAPWIVASGCDALIVRLDRDPVERHAARWSAGPSPLPQPERERRLAAWVTTLRRAGIATVTTGLWTLRRRARGRHFMAVEDASAPPTGEQLLSLFQRASGGLTPAG